MSIPDTRYQASLTGIYFLFRDNVLQYIGQSQNVMQRVGQHLRNKQFDTFTYIECNIAELNDMEIRYIRQYNPPLNHAYARNLMPFYALNMSAHKELIDRHRGNVTTKCNEHVTVSRCNKMKVLHSPLSDYYWSNRLSIDESYIATMRQSS